MQPVLTTLAAAADPTRLRLLALAASGAFCVNDFCEILNQSQPRLSRHLRLLTEAGLLNRAREGTNVWFTLSQGPQAGLAQDILRKLDAADPLIAADRRGAARVRAERARAATAHFTDAGADWDEMRALGLPAERVEVLLLAILSAAGAPDATGPSLGRQSLGRMLDIGTGTGRLLEVLAPFITSGLGLDASRAMLALSRVRLARPEFGHIALRLADMYALPLADQSFDLVVLHMVLHFATDPDQVLAEACRVLAPAGRLVVVDLGSHNDETLITRYKHRHLGFDSRQMAARLADFGLYGVENETITAAYPITIWCAQAAILPPPAKIFLETVTA